MEVILLIFFVFPAAGTAGPIGTSEINPFAEGATPRAAVARRSPVSNLFCLLWSTFSFTLFSSHPGITGVAPFAPHTVGDDAFTRVYFGGSGAASGCHSSPGRDGAAGGKSGGIIIIAARRGILIGPSASITAAGGNGENGYRTTSNFQQSMGGGGGGAGGAIWLISATNTTANTARISVGGLGERRGRRRKEIGGEEGRVQG